MLRVEALYRVSTAQQVDITKDDIPMQKIACRHFAEEKGWDIVAEYEEKGVSGFKVSANDRDKIQQLKDDALNKKFDVLLVFMFDRLGRIENETPFVLEWFSQHGIAVWSVNEGEQKFDSHVDKLMNYIRFWQASGESEKTSIRVKTRMSQMTTEGIYTGGALPYGYHLEYRGRKNKKGHDMGDIAVEPSEAEYVKQVFQKTITEGCGSHQLAEYLNKRGCKTHKGAPFQSNTIIRMLRNKLYCGFIVNGEVTSERIPELQLIDDRDFDRVQEILLERSGKNEEKRTIAKNNKALAMLSGNIYCAHCGSRLVTSRYRDHYTRKDGSEYRADQIRYVCYHRSRGLKDCDGASTYIAEKIDRIVVDVMKTIFSSISGCPEEEKIQLAYKQAMAANHHTQQKLTLELQSNEAQLDKLRQEIGRALVGESSFSSEDLNTAIKTIKGKIETIQNRLTELADEDGEKKRMADGILPAYRQFRSWAQEFDEATLETKRMIASQLFNRIEIGSGYTVHLEMNMTYKQFCEDWIAPEILTAMK